MMLLAIQNDGAALHPHGGSLLGPLVMIAFGACVGAILIPALGFVVRRGRAMLARHRARRRRARDGTVVERRARAMMSELCPHGWWAQITLLDGAERGDGEPVPAPVVLDWHELLPGGEPAVTRRVWSQTVAGALERMVADRRTDETLEQIELRATADGALWPDL